MKIQDYLQSLRDKKIPPEPPDHCTEGGFHRHTTFGEEGWFSYALARTECIDKIGLFPILDQIWIRALADWIGKRHVLEIMAGPGWIAKALSEQGVTIFATDNKSWWGEHRNKKDSNFILVEDVFPVGDLDAVQAVKNLHDAYDVLLVSWPYMDNIVHQACSEWDASKPIIYIGESDGGCTADAAFFSHFQPFEKQPHIPLKSWDGIHDHVEIGTYQKEADLSKLELMCICNKKEGDNKYCPYHGTGE